MKVSTAPVGTQAGTKKIRPATNTRRGGCGESLQQNEDSEEEREVLGDPTEEPFGPGGAPVFEGRLKEDPVTAKSPKAHENLLRQEIQNASEITPP